jgi:2-oxoglutarate dehydrogenase E1 component
MNDGKIEADLAKNLEKSFKEDLQKSFEIVKDLERVKSNNLKPTTWAIVRKSKDIDFEKSVKTSISEKIFKDLYSKITSIPDGFSAFSKTKRLFAARAKMLENNGFDWAMGELMAYASLLNEGHPVRMSGQDVERGTFSHRHAIILDEKTLDTFSPLDNVSDKTAFEIYNSLLSEYAVLSYEYGYSTTEPNGLTIWEAQFGDFANGAQIAIDQYISSGEAKWGRFSGLTMLLPHGHEGQGPEHTSARPERFLQLCANNNMYVLNCTTPANFFHALRRQLKNEFRIPLVVLTPKSLLRHPKCVSTLSDFTKTNFTEIIKDSYADLKNAKRVVFCSGKIYYDLLEEQQKNNRKDVALIRVEQLYPLPEKQIEAIMNEAKNAQCFWVQEEPKNQGYWTHILRYDLGRKLEVISRRSSASPATGFAAVHAEEQAAIIAASFDC